MKQQIAFILLLFSLFTRAQTDKITEALFKTPNIAIESATLLHGEGVRDAWQVLIFGEDDAFAKSWKKFIKNNYSLEGHREGGMYVCGPVLSAALSADTISVLYKIEKDGDFIRMTLLSKTKQNYSTPTDGTGLMDKTKAMIEGISSALPDCEFILVASMLGNRDWTRLNHDVFPKYRDALKQLDAAAPPR